MSWTTPRTWTTGELVTASLLNAHVRDNLAYLKNAPTFDGAVTITGALAANAAATVTGIFTVNGFGTHAHSAGGTGGNAISVRNTTAGTGNYGAVQLGNDTSATRADISMFSTTFTPASYNAADGLRLYCGGAGGINIAADHASGNVRIYANGSTQVVDIIGAGGGIPHLSILPYAGGTGAIPGAYVFAGRNSSGSGAPGTLTAEAKNGTSYFLWTDTTGVVRTSSAAPTESGGDTTGTVVGSQTSTRASKIIDGAFTDAKKALRLLVVTPLYRFHYKNGAYNHQRFVGITTDDSPEFGMDKGRSFNPVNAFGYSVAAIKELARRLDQIEARA